MQPGRSVIERAAPRNRLARWQALNLVLLVGGYTGYYLCRSDLSVSMPLLIAELHRRGMATGAARLVLGAIASYGVLAYAIGKFPSGSLADRFGGKGNFLIGMAGSIVFTLLFAASGTVPVFTLVWMGNRLVQSLGWAGAVKIVSRWFPFSRYGAVMGVVSLSFLFGDAACRQLMALLIAAGFGWRAVFVVAACVLAAVLAVCAWLIRESPVEIGEAEPSANPANLFATRTGNTRVGSLRDRLQPFLNSGVFWLACALSLGTTILRETLTLWTPTYFNQAVGMTPAEAAAASGLFPFFGGISVLVCGWLSDRLKGGGRAAIMTVGLLLAGMTLLALGLGVVPATRTAVVTVVAAAALLILGPYSFLAGAISLDFGGKQGSGTASGLIDGIGYMGGVLSGSGMAQISVRYGWGGAFLILAVFALLSSLAAGFLLRQIAVSKNYGLR
ncbi:MAG TPA: MFS transporter [Bryobacteraceae bacterium]|nr:MFS transporter [Bryobacteraceae bacterium]